MLKKWQEVVDTDFPPVGVVDDSIHEQIEQQRRWLRGSVRLTTGRILTEEGYKRRREQALRKLP